MKFSFALSFFLLADYMGGINILCRNRITDINAAVCIRNSQICRDTEIQCGYNSTHTIPLGILGRFWNRGGAWLNYSRANSDSTIRYYIHILEWMQAQ